MSDKNERFPGRQKGSRGGRNRFELAPENLLKFETYTPPTSTSRQKKKEFLLPNEKFSLVASLTSLCTGSKAASLDLSVPVDWEDVAALETSPELDGTSPSCPICLENDFLCPRMSKCGHIFCWPCFLEYFERTKSSEHEGKYWRRCPLCFESVLRDELKPVRFRRFERSLKKTGSSFVLASRDRSSHIVHCGFLEQAVSTLEDQQNSKASGENVISVGERLLNRVINDDWTQDCYFNEYLSLQIKKQLCLDEESDMRAFMDEAIKILENLIDSPSDWQEKSTAWLSETMQELRNAGIDSHSELLLLAYKRAIERNFVTYTVTVENSPEVEVPEDLGFWDTAARDQEFDVGLGSRVCDNPVSRTSLPQKPSNTSYFFQSWDGQLKFLSPSMMRILLYDAGKNVNRLPPLIQNAAILHTDSVVTSTAAKKTYPFLYHLPSGLSVKVVDIDIRPFVCAATQNQFSDKINELMERKEEADFVQLERDREVERSNRIVSAAKTVYASPTLYEFSSSDQPETNTFPDQKFHCQDFPSLDGTRSPLPEINSASSSYLSASVVGTDVRRTPDIQVGNEEQLNLGASRRAWGPFKPAEEVEQRVQEPEERTGQGTKKKRGKKIVLEFL